MQILIVHAERDRELAEQLAEPLSDAGFVVAHRGTLMVGDSITNETSRILADRGPVLLCGTATAIGSRWARTVLNAARQHGCKILCVQMERDAAVESLTFDEVVAEYWNDPTAAMAGVIATLRRMIPGAMETTDPNFIAAAESRYRQLTLTACDIVDVAYWGEAEVSVVAQSPALRRLYVPLQVVVEASAGSEVRAEILQSLEERRAQARGWSDAPPGTRGSRCSLGERLLSVGRLIILGDPGAGKTTVLKWLATAYLLRHNRDPSWNELPGVDSLPDTDWLPVIIRCRDLDRRSVDGALDDILAHTFHKAELSDAEGTVLRNLIRRRLDEGTAMLLIDGLDEIVDATLRARFARQLESIHIGFPRAPIIATSRIVGYREMGFRVGHGFEHLTVADLIREQKDEFVNRWCALTEPPERRDAAARALIEDVHSTDRLERLTGNPMLLTTMALVRSRLGRLPNRRVELYAEAFRLLLHWRGDVDAPIDYHEAAPQLGYLAHAMCDRGVQKLRDDEVVGLLNQMRGEFAHLGDVFVRSPREFLRAVVQRTGLLMESGHVRHLGQLVPVYEFRHLTFQEYLAALALVSGQYMGRMESEPLSQVVGRLAGNLGATPNQFGELAVAENWREAVRLWVSIAAQEDVDDLLTGILAQNDSEENDELLRARTILAAQCLADEVEAGNHTANRILRLLARVADERDMFASPISSLQVTVAELMQTRWRELLEQILVNEYVARRPFTRSSVGRVLGTAFIPQIYDSEKVQDAWSSIWTNVDDDFSAVLIALLKAAAFTDFLGMMSARSLDVACSVLGSELPLALAGLQFLVSSLEMGSTKEAVLYVSTAITYAVSTQWQHLWTDPETRLLTIKIMGWIAMPDMVEQIIDELLSENAAVRAAAAVALGRMNSRSAIDPLLISITDNDADVRESAFAALSDILHPFGLAREPELFTMLANRDSQSSHHISTLAKQLVEKYDEMMKPVLPSN